MKKIMLAMVVLISLIIATFTLSCTAEFNFESPILEAPIEEELVEEEPVEEEPVEEEPIEEEPIEEEPTEILIDKIEYYSPNGSLDSTITFMYSIYNYVIKSETLFVNGGIETIDYYYQYGKIIEKTHSNTNTVSVHSFHYIENLITLHISSERYLYLRYNEDGYLELNFGRSGKIEYFYSGNEVIKSINDEIETFYEYDNAKWWHKLLLPDSFLSKDRLSDSNLIKKTTGNVVITYEYQYNSIGNPTRIIERKNGQITKESKIYYNQ